MVAKGSVMCEFCGKEIPKNNLELHNIRCGKEQQVENRLEETEKKVIKENTTKAPKKNAKSQQSTKKKPIVENDKGDEDFDELVAEFTKVDSKCSHEKCRASVLILKQYCDFCGKTYCLKHGLAEVHGCGQAAKIHAQRKAKESYQKQPVKKLNVVQKNYVKRKLEKKISEMEVARTKANDKDKK